MPSRESILFFIWMQKNKNIKSILKLYHWCVIVHKHTSNLPKRECVSPWRGAHVCFVFLSLFVFFVCLYFCMFMSLFFHCLTHFQLTSKRVCVSLGMCSWNCQSQAARFHFEYLPGEIIYSSTYPLKYYIYYLPGEITYCSTCPVKYFLVLLAVYRKVILFSLSTLPVQ